MKKFFKYIGRIVLAIFLLLVLVLFLLYLPPVQNYLKNKTVSYISSHYGLVVKADHFRLGFPLNLTLEGVYAGTTESDTLAAVQKLHLQVGLKNIFRKQLSVEDLSLIQVRFNMANDSSGMQFKLAVDSLSLAARQVDLNKRLVEAEYIRLGGGDVFLQVAETMVVDTTTSKPLDWTFEVGEIGLREVSYRMNTDSLPFLGAGIHWGTLLGGKVALGLQKVEVDSVAISGAWCNLKITPTDTLRAVAVDTMVSQPWTVEAGTLQLDNSAFSMEPLGEQRMEMILSGIAVRLDSVYNRGTVVRAALKDLKAVQKDGIAITAMQADVTLDSTETVLQGAYIRTVNSWVRLEASTETDVQHLLETVPLTLVLNGQIGLQDIMPFYPDIPLSLQKKKVNINTSLALTNRRLQLGQLILDMPGHFKVTGSGSLTNFSDLKKMRGSLILRGEMPDITFAQTFLEKVEGVVIPRQMDMLVRFKADRGNLSSLLRLCCEKGCLSLDGSYQMQRQAYDAELTLNQFPLQQFLPGDSLGNISAVLRMTGNYFSWSEARAELNAHIQQMDFRKYSYRNVLLDATLNRTKLKGSLVSHDSIAPLSLVFRADSVDGFYDANLAGTIGTVDVQALHLVQEPFTVGVKLEMQATMGKDEIYRLHLGLDSLKMTDSHKKYTLGSLSLDLNSDLKKTALELVSGDLSLHFQTDTSLMGFIGEAGKVAQLIQEQINTRNIDMELVKDDLPPFSLQITGAQHNAIAGFLKSRDIGFKNLMLDVVSRKRNGIRIGFAANAPYFGSVRLDSIQLGAWQTGKSLSYSCAAGSSADAWKGLFNVNVTGRMQGDQFRVELKQKDADRQIGFDLGINLTFGDTTMIVSLFPVNPILGYSRWIVNPDNKIVIGKDGKVHANLRMAYLNKLINIQSLANLGEMKDRLQVEINGIDLSALSRLVPFMPELGGFLNTNLLLYTKNEDFGADGDIQVVELEYGRQRIGTVDLAMQYAGGERFTKHAVNFELKVDSVRRVVAQGKFSTSENDRNVAVDLDIPSFPLYITNAFIPADLMKLSGELLGQMHFRGTVDNPELNGDLAFREAKADVVMLGTTFKLDTARVLVENGKILFRKYRFIALNNSDMILNGDIQLTPFNQMNMNLSVNANNFEVVNVKKNNTSLIYGKAYANINSRIAGKFSALNVTGNVNLLNRTAITYVLRSSDPQLVDKSVDLVRFVSFQDTTLNEVDDLTNRVNPSSFSMRMLIEIGDQVSVGVDLSEDGNDRVIIQGGGNLVLSMNPESGMVLSGKYILSDGTVVYNVPIVGKKEFSIRSGSYVEWTGNVMNPILNISASEQVKANVDDGEQTRQVTFESIIRIQNTLSRPDITFDLSAPNDMVIQNQLATFSPEERTRQALNLLIYNTYTAPGAAKSTNSGSVANNAIYSFVENELNKYTRKAGLTVGFDSHNTDENTTRTDVTYQFSRQLFNDRVRVKIGGRISTDANENQSSSLQDNLVDDISIEYVLTKKRNLYAKVFRHSNYESVLDGEVTQTGVGIVWRKNFRKFKDLFKNKNREERRREKGIVKD